MTELKILCEDAELLRQLVQQTIEIRLQSLNEGIGKTQTRLHELETKYEMSTTEFLQLFENNELSHTWDFDEWIGEAKMLQKLLNKKAKLGGIQFVN